MALNSKKIKSLKSVYQNKGYVILKNIFSKIDIKKAGQDIEQFLLENVKNLRGRNINKNKNNIINSVHRMNEWIWTKKFKKNKDLNKLIEALLKDRPKDFGSELFAKPAKTGLASPMHQDNYYWCLDNANGLTIWIAIDDSHKNNGGVYYFEKSHQLGLLEHIQSFAPGSSQTLKYPIGMKNFKKKLPILKKGDCLIHHSLVVHGSNKNTSSFARRGLTIRYIGTKAKIDKLKKKKYEAELKTNIEN
jgi:phytanoyl-CoA hydroxylase